MDRNIHKEIADFRDSAPGYGIRLRDYFSQLVLNRLDELDWTQRRLADASDMKESFISRVVRGGSNCTFEVAGTILHALGVEPAVYDPTTHVLTDARPSVSETTGEADGEAFEIDETDWPEGIIASIWTTEGSKGSQVYQAAE